MNMGTNLTLVDMQHIYDGLTGVVKRAEASKDLESIKHVAAVATDALANDTECPNLMALVFEYAAAAGRAVKFGVDDEPAVAVDLTGISPFNGQPVVQSQPVAQAPRRVGDGSSNIGLSQVINGTYTVVLQDGTHVTLKLSDWKSKSDGTRVLAYLCGPDNTNDYQGIASIEPSGRVIWWGKAQREGAFYRITDATRKLGLMSSDEKIEIRATTCARCGRKLTTPESIQAGYGPECINLI